MFGVVLWSDETDRKAVFWCEDQGDLAFYDDAENRQSGYDFFDAGDMVRFDIHIDCRLRKAQNACLVVEQACADLPEHLLNSVSPKTTPPNPRSATVLPFVRPEKRTDEAVFRLKAPA